MTALLTNKLTNKQAKVQAIKQLKVAWEKLNRPDGNSLTWPRVADQASQLIKKAKDKLTQCSHTNHS